MLQGNTLFAGDSMTVGTPPFVKVNGVKRTEAAVGRSSAQLLASLQAPDVFDGMQNMVVLIGANDIGGIEPSKTVRAIWALAKSKGLRVYAMTVPPDKGWSNFASNFDAINARRKTLNAALAVAAAAGEADGLIDLATLMADQNDPDKLSAAYDSGDHLHPRKDAMGALLTSALGGAAMTPPMPSVPSPLGQPQAESAFPWTTILLVGAVVGGTILLARKDYAGVTMASRLLHRIP